MIKETLDIKLLKIRSELKYIANLHDLHIIELVKLFNQSLIEAYGYSKKDSLVLITDNNQLVFFNTQNSTEKLFNISIVKFNKFLKIFNKKIDYTEDNKLINDFIDDIIDTKYIELVAIEKSRKYLTLRTKKNTKLFKNITFKYKILSKDCDNFISNNESFWITINKKQLNQMEQMNSIKKKLTLDCNIKDLSIIKLLVKDLLEKIRTKTNNKININFKFYNYKNNIVNLTCDEFIPQLFIQYIESYIYKHTQAKVSFLR